jgi:hypothetical protein
MVGLIGCGCCNGGGGGGDPPVSCGACDGAYFGYSSDRGDVTDNFSFVDPKWELRGGYDHRGPQPPVTPNNIADYLRDGKLYAFRSPFIIYNDPDPLFGAGVRAIPPKPTPDSWNFRQPWVWVRRRHDLYFPSPAIRRYTFKINANYPQNTLPRLASLDGFVGPAMGVFMRVWFGAPETRTFPGSEFFSFTVAGQGLTPGTDTNPNATLSVGISQINPQRNDHPTFSPTFETSVTVPWGLVELRMDVTWNPISKSGTREYYVNGTLYLTKTFTGWLSPSIPGQNCDSFCNFITDIESIEPWKVYASSGAVTPVIWWRGGLPPNESFARGNQGFPGSPGPAAYAAVTWSSANNPQDRLWFDDYSVTISTLGGPGPA